MHVIVSEQPYGMLTLPLQTYRGGGWRQDKGRANQWRGKNRFLVIHELIASYRWTNGSSRLQENKLSFQKNLMNIYVKLVKKTQKVSTYNQLDFDMLGYHPIMPK